MKSGNPAQKQIKKFDSGLKYQNMALKITTNTGAILCKFSGLPLLRSPFL